MAKINENLLVNHARGNVGKQFVYKKRGNTTYIARMPKKNKNLLPNEQQEQIRERFASASLYAKGAITSEELKKQYEKKVKPGGSAANVAFKDYLSAPKVKSIDVMVYNGNPGSTITSKVRDDFRVVRVNVKIHTAAGIMVEEGDAILNPLDLNKWIYTATQANPELAGSRITVTAYDLPGNTGTLEVNK